MAKTYKNMSTILEKVKTGKIDNVVKTNKFSNIKYFKKNEIIEPYLHIVDTEVLSRNLWHFVSYQMHNNKVFNKIHEKINAKNVNLKGKEITKTDLANKMIGIYTSFPKEIIYDIFNQFNTNSYKLKYKDRTPGNKNRFKFIDKANDSVLKIITNNSNIRSLVFTENILQYYLSLLVELEMDNPEDFKNLMKDLKKKDDDNDSGDSNDATNNQDDDKQDGDGNKTDVSSQPVDNQQDTTNQNGDDSQNDTTDSSVPKQNNNQQSSGAGKGISDQKQTSPDELLNKMLTPTKENEKLFNDVVEQAKESIDFIEKIMSEDEIQKHWDTKNAEKFNPEGLRKVQNILKTIELNSDSLKPYIKKIVDKSFSYFDSKTTEVYDEFLNNPEVSEIIGFEYFHPKFKNLMIEDIQIKDTKKVGKVNVYLDVSGSMSSSAGIKDTPMDKLTFSKALLLKLKKMDVINQVFTFNTSIKTLKDPDLSTMLTIDTSGGTSLNTVISDIIKKDKPSIVITDADDSIDQYSEKAFLLGVAGASFHRITRHALEQYRANNQLIVFNGDDVKKVNERGYAIN
jgi:hypothetical protein